ncbi:MAG: GDSL-type esterase/lipase family protein [Acidobacteria bacterium]|nr:GDSL-type esterase/lipase family protein [Acidobacteriota bacterium]
MRALYGGIPTLLALGLTTACTESPTSPTRATTGPTVGIISQTPPPVPPRANPGVATTAVGATRFLAFGDSITFGTLSSFDGVFLYDGSPQAYPARLELGLKTYHPAQAPAFTVLNRGVPGEGAVEGARRIASLLATIRPQALLVLEGINDLNSGRSVGQTVSALDTMLDYARVYNVPAVVATMFQTYEVERPNGEHRTNAAALVPSLNAAIRQMVAGRQNVFVADVHAAFGTNRSLVGGDGLHPTEAGYERMATTFMAAIEQAFPVRGTAQ